jgi:ketosteroid isomerase-like protein
MTRSAEDTIREFWRLQDSGDYNLVVPLFAEDAVLVDPIFGEFHGKAAIADFMAKMVEEMGARETRFTLVEVAGGGDTAWAQWIAHTPRGDIEGCGLYRVRDGYMTYYRDYMNAGSGQGEA